MSSSTSIILALCGGVLPSIIWLWFWLHEDRRHPEPKRRIVMSFIFGMLAVIVVLPIEKLLFNVLGPNLDLQLLAAWSGAEELVKFLAAYCAALRFADADEPIDFIIYMVTAALGFSALENSFYLVKVIGDSAILQSVVNGNMRFLGATLLHLITSATIGVFMGLAYYKDRQTRRLSLGAGIMFAIGLHTLFNFFIMNRGERVFFVFGIVWFLILALILIFEKIKNVFPSNTDIIKN